MDMANANKKRGDAAERAVRDYLTDVVGEGAVIKTRAGFNDDLGDVLADLPSGEAGGASQGGENLQMG